jgi:hypothetical protein
MGTIDGRLVPSIVFVKDALPGCFAFSRDKGDAMLDALPGSSMRDQCGRLR